MARNALSHRRLALAPILAALIAAISFSAAAGSNEKGRMQADRKPVWEVNILALQAYSPNYPASDEYDYRFLAIPFPIYRSKNVQFGGGNIMKGKARLHESMTLSLSLSASFGSSSGQSAARRGLPSVNYLFAIGPKLDIVLDRGDRDKTLLLLPARLTFSTDFSSASYRGLVFSPEVGYYYRFSASFRVSAYVNTSFADRSLQQFYYQVDPQFATATRPAYEAQAGYLGSSIGLRGRLRFSRTYFFFSSIKLTSYHGAENQTSPLFRSKLNGSIFLGLGARLFASEELSDEPYD